MEPVVVAPPAIEPVTLAEAKKHARMFEDLTEDDSDMGALIVAAREKLEAMVQRSLIVRTWEVELDGFPAGGLIRLPRPPLVSVDSVAYLDQADAERVLDPSLYRAIPGTPGRLRPAAGASWPIAASVPGSVRIRYTAGYGATAAAVPDVAKLCIKILATHWYSSRTPVAATAVAKVPFTVDALADVLRWGAYRR